MNINADKKRAVLYAICGVLTVLIAAGLIRELFFPQQQELKNVQLLPAPKPLVFVELKAVNSVVNLQQAHDAWFLVFMGYTYCPDVCPVELQKLGQMLDKFSESGKPPPVVLFVSVDPERDSVEKVKEYAAYFHPAIQGLTGSNMALRSLATFFGVTYHRTVTIGKKEYLVEAGADMPVGSGEHYLVHHSSRILVINPQGQYIGSFSPPYTADILYEDMKTLMSQE